VIDWGEIQWNELDNTGVVATSDYDDIDWGEIQFSELDWGKSKDSDILDWGEVQWSELDKSDFTTIRWEHVGFSELDSADWSSIRNGINSSPSFEIGTNLGDKVYGDSTNNSLFGVFGNDQIFGNAGDDRLFGCSTEQAGGRKEIDELTGGVGKDIFVLGSEFGVLYDDGSTKSSGKGDYAVIKDYTPGADNLQLFGSKTDYFLGASGVGGLTGTGLFYDTNDNTRLDASDELVAILQSKQAINSLNTIATAQFV
jgi:hypothetical protein